MCVGGQMMEVSRGDIILMQVPRSLMKGNNCFIPLGMMERFVVKKSHSKSLFCSDDGTQFRQHTYTNKVKVNEMTGIRRRKDF